MPVPEYFVALRDHHNLTLAEFANYLKTMPKKIVGDVTVAELCSMTEYPNGLYLFFDNDEVLWYVGKSTSRSFIERVPSHFDQREDAWFNTLPKRIMAISQISEYHEAHALGLSLRLILVGIKSKETASKVERMLRGHMKPHLNTDKKSTFSGAEQLIQYEA